MAYYLKTNGNKYKAKKQEYDGKKYDSKGEASYAMELDWRIKAGEIVNGVLICNYIADFMVTTKHDALELHEYKGLVLPLFQLKWKLLQALKDELFPQGIELIMIQHKSYKPNRKKK
jgi:hypothetical protein